MSRHVKEYISNYINHLGKLLGSIMLIGAFWLWAGFPVPATQGHVKKKIEEQAVSAVTKEDLKKVEQTLEKSIDDKVDALEGKVDTIIMILRPDPHKILENHK